jgi:hypothetical protein
LTNEAITGKILSFLDSIGLEWKEESLGDETFMPGVDIGNGILLVDREKLKYPGDLLHEAGHIAMLEASRRHEVSGDAGAKDGRVDGEEIGAILWSYAATVAIGIPPETVFHPDGYKGQSDWHIENFTSGNYVGLPLLEWMGLCISPEKAKATGEEGFPKMKQWLRS